MMSLAEAARAVSGRLAGPDAGFTGVSTDTRGLRPGVLFVALRGERFDGHQFVSAALSAGAAGAMIDARAQVIEGAPIVVVDDTRAALGRLAASWRARQAIALIAVVGSNGKTTVKEMIAAILREAFGPDAMLATEGNLNNDIGLPLTVLRLRAGHRVAVVELGMNHPGETALLAAIAQPTIGLINNAQREHQEFMKSVEDVAREHAALIRALPAGATVVLNADDQHYGLWRDVAHECNVLVRDFAIEASATVRGRCSLSAFTSEVELSSPEGACRFTVPLPGAHNARNAVAAAAAATAAGADLGAVVLGLSGFAAVQGRQQRRRSQGGAVMIDDTYNANPESVRAAIDVLRAFAPPTVLVLGDMGEVGSQGEAFHQEIGGYAHEAGVTHLFGLGELSRHAVQAFGPGAMHASNVDELVRALSPFDREGATLLIKGSRFMRMERVVAAFAGDAQPRGGAH